MATWSRLRLVLIGLAALCWVLPGNAHADARLELDQCMNTIGITGLGNPPSINLAYCCMVVRSRYFEEPPGCGMDFGTDRPGSDMVAGGRGSVSPIDCQLQCQNNTACLAFTYVRGSGRCYLKTAIPARRRDNCCISGVVRRTPDFDPRFSPPPGVLVWREGSHYCYCPPGAQAVASGPNYLCVGGRAICDYRPEPPPSGAGGETQCRWTGPGQTNCVCDNGPTSDFWCAFGDVR